MRMKKTMSWMGTAAAVLALSALPAFGTPQDPAPTKEAEKKSESKMTKTPTGLQYEDTVVGTGASPKTGQTCVMNYTGWLWENGAKGKKFDSSLDHGAPFEFSLGGRVIKG